MRDLFPSPADPRRHAAALDIVVDCLDPHAQRRQRRFQIMPDRAEHDVFLIEQRAHTALHGIVRHDQALDIYWTFRFKLPGRGA